MTPTDRPSSGHRLVAHTADCIIEAWAPERARCLEEVLVGLVDAFAVVPDAAATRALPLAAGPGGPEDLVVGLIEDVIYTMDVLGVVPVRFHLADTEDGGIAGDMEVVDAHLVETVGPAPKGVTWHGLAFGPDDGGWRCHVLVDV